MRKAFIDTLTELARKDKRVMCVIGDTGYSVFEDFEAEFGERFVNVGIAEQNFISFGAGLAAMGMKPYLYNVASFMTLRSMEQIVLDICYQENPVVMIAVGGGYAYGTGGPTHHAMMDIAMMREIPNMTVVCPADPIEMREVMLKSILYNKPLYIRIGRNTDPIIHKNNIKLEIGKALLLKEGEDGVIFATGTMVKEALIIHEKLCGHGFRLKVYSMHTIKPIDSECIIKNAGHMDYMVSLEEHSIIGGLGTAIKEILQDNDLKRVKFKAFGARDEFAPCTGDTKYLDSIEQLDAECIIDWFIEQKNKEE